MAPHCIAGRLLAVSVALGVATSASAAPVEGAPVSPSDPAGEPTEPLDPPADPPATGDRQPESGEPPATDPDAVEPGPEADVPASAPPSSEPAPPSTSAPVPAPLPVTTAPAGNPWETSSGGGSSSGSSPWGDADRGRKRSGPRDRTPKPGTGLIVGGSLGFVAAVVGVGVMGAGFSKAGKATDDLASTPAGSREGVFADGRKANRMAIAGAVVMSVGAIVGVTLVALGAVKRRRGRKPADTAPIGQALGLRLQIGGGL